jgi:hypothetical protein
LYTKGKPTKIGLPTKKFEIEKTKQTAETMISCGPTKLILMPYLGDSGVLPDHHTGVPSIVLETSRCICCLILAAKWNFAARKLVNEGLVRFYTGERSIDSRWH